MLHPDGTVRRDHCFSDGQGTGGGISTVWYIEFSNHLVADAIAEAAGAGTAMFHTCHNVSPNELAGGETYVTLMRGNLERLRAHLNER